MSNLRKKLAELGDEETQVTEPQEESLLRQDFGNEPINKAVNKWNKISPMTLFLLPETQLFNQLSAIGNIVEIKRSFIQKFKEINDKYINDKEFSHWSDAKVKEMELAVNKAKNINQIFDYVSRSDFKGSAYAELSSSDYRKIAASYLEIADHLEKLCK